MMLDFDKFRVSLFATIQFLLHSQQFILILAFKSALLSSCVNTPTSDVGYGEIKSTSSFVIFFSGLCHRCAAVLDLCPLCRGEISEKLLEPRKELG